MLKNWRPLAYALLMALLRWLQDELNNGDKKQLRKRERIMFPEDADKARDLQSMDDLESQIEP